MGKGGLNPELTELWKDSGIGTTIPGSADLGLVERVLLAPSALFRESA